MGDGNDGKEVEATNDQEQPCTNSDGRLNGNARVAGRSGVRRCHNPPGELLTRAAKSVDLAWPWNGKANDDGDDELAENAKLIDDGESMTPSQNNPRSTKILKDGHST
ncbi:hypothetical protein R1flu_004923 [Riccia fluitans]|uniref:Uncharacterized protein n=1 Tax=Riccia fluitans TaxID=41844 RepID=A0ABD1YUI7_9MARC